ncbi:SLC13 family permease [Cereibacter sphaeroides]|uniref:SLC13 family permease n=1 Tax=Cereibacter sphaeroides TaxID=1063 RepID=UPI001F44A1F2|nr:SLC13 family permease [Cereibacter sphaeroides]MCE6969994.1 SLC13 family permease [Cereibacter sphaeroides]
MLSLHLDPAIAPWAAIAVVLGMLVLFVLETVPVEVTAIVGATVMVLLGLLPQDEVLDVLSNAAPWTIAAMFVIVGSLVRTGALDWVTRIATAHVGLRPRTTVAVLGVGIVALSAVVNNTPVVVVFLPVFIQLAAEMRTAPSKLLIPLSYLSIMGGTVTLIGTSTNLVVDGVARSAGLDPFGIFEITPVGLPLAIVGMLYLGFLGNRLLPERSSMAGMLTGRRKMKFFTEVAVPEGSPLIGKPLDQVDIFRRSDVQVIDVLRGDASLRRALQGVELQVGDRVVLRSPMGEILNLQGARDLHLVDRLASVQTQTVEVLITPGCRMIGRSLGELRLRRRYGVYPLAVHRRNRNLGRQMDDVVVAVGDTLLLEGSAEDIGRLAQDMDLTDLSHPQERPFRRKRAPVAAAVLTAIILLSSFDVAPIEILAFIGVAIVLVTRCIDSEEAFSSIDGRLMAMLFGMIAVGAGLDHSGAVELIVGWAEPWLAGMAPWLLIFCVFALTSFLTELLSNNAVAVVVTPLAIELAQRLGIDPRPLLVAVMMGASFGFATPIGYQCNLLVYGPGGYTFGDFLKIGVPLNVLMGIAAAIVIPLVYGL